MTPGHVSPTREAALPCAPASCLESSTLARAGAARSAASRRAPSRVALCAPPVKPTLKTALSGAIRAIQRPLLPPAARGRAAVWSAMAEAPPEAATKARIEFTGAVRRARWESTAPGREVASAGSIPKSIPFLRGSRAYPTATLRPHRAKPDCRCRVAPTVSRCPVRPASPRQSIAWGSSGRAAPAVLPASTRPSIGPVRARRTRDARRIRARAKG
jgi:hypothetical protein